MFVVYNIKTTSDVATSETLSGAKRSATCMNRKLETPTFAATGVEDYNDNVVKMVEKTNYLTGEKYMEKSNTPHYCSPSSESYWSM